MVEVCGTIRQLFMEFVNVQNRCGMTYKILNYLYYVLEGMLCGQLTLMILKLNVGKSVLQEPHSLKIYQAEQV